MIDRLNTSALLYRIAPCLRHNGNNPGSASGTVSENRYSKVLGSHGHFLCISGTRQLRTDIKMFAVAKELGIPVLEIGSAGKILCDEHFELK